jgi:hypothetical protein
MPRALLAVVILAVGCGSKSKMPPMPPADTLGTPCTTDTDCPAPFECMIPPGQSDGFCSQYCTDDSQCDDPGLNTACGYPAGAADHCVIKCDVAPDCPDGLACDPTTLQCLPPPPPPTCEPDGAACGSSLDCCGTSECIGGHCGSCNAGDVYCAEQGGTCWSAGTACNTITQCGADLLACSYSFLAVDCASRTCDCPDPAYPVFCGESGGLYASCWSPGTDCSTRVDCGGTEHSCHVGSHYDCSTSGCYCDSPGTHYCAGAGTCVDLLTDPNNCGSCGATCPAGYSCQNGTTCSNTPPCGPGLTYCNGACRDLSNDWGNCGTCGVSCDSPPYCDEFGCISCYYDCISGSCVQQMCSGP